MARDIIKFTFLTLVSFGDTVVTPLQSVTYYLNWPLLYQEMLIEIETSANLCIYIILQYLEHI